MPTPLVHPHFGLSYALEGRIITMDSNNTILPRGRIFVRNGNIIDIRPVNGGYPKGFEKKDVIKSGGTIYPGLIELHNHLPYNILPFWVSETRFENHEKWKGIRGYKVNVQGPMQTLGKSPGFPQAIVKYVEYKCLVGGVTTSQGVTLYRSNLKKAFFRGMIRNVEETNEAALPEALTRIADLPKNKAKWFRDKRLSPTKTTLLHLAEGVDERARTFFQRLKIDNNSWAITDKLNGIHCTGLLAEDFEILRLYGGSMTWSPFSNILLYGGTADIEAAKSNNIRICLGSDWSPTGSKNLLEEIKVAKLVSDNHPNGPIFTHTELVEMVTKNPAQILGWDNELGTIGIGKKADLIIINGYTGDPYLKLIDATEKNINGVFINGVPRYAIQRIISKFGFPASEIEPIIFDHSKRFFFIRESDPENLLQGISIEDATCLLRGGLQDLQNLSILLENSAGSNNGLLSATENPMDLDWILLPDFHQGDLDPNGLNNGVFEWGATVKYSEVAIPLPLDSLTVIDDDEHFKRLTMQPNLPDYIRTHFPRYYDRPALGSLQNSYGFSESIHPSLNIAVTLEIFRKRSSNLTKINKLTILRQVRLILDQVYVHKVLKKSMYAINPIEQVDRMINDIQFDLKEDYDDDNYFHHKLLEIFSSLRDLHTKYLLPDPYRNRFAFLPFLIEEYYETPEDEASKFIVTKTFDTIIHQDSFGIGVEILFWNNIPIKRAIEINASAQSGSNDDARHARGIDTLTIRPLGSTIPPDENAVKLTCKDSTGQIFEVEYEWMVSYYPPHFSLLTDQNMSANLAYGGDYDTLAVNNVKLAFYVTRGDQDQVKRHKSEWIRPDNDYSMRAKSIPQGKRKRVGYIRVFSFTTTDENAFLANFIQLLDDLKPGTLSGLIIDIRGNGGGLITACELLLAELSGKNFIPQEFQFLSSGLTLDLSRKHDCESKMVNLEPWTESLLKSKSTGETYSLGCPISSLSKAHKAQRIFTKPIVLITDAMCYSAADMFAAGFQDLKIGKILGVHDNTGAGGANVWSHNMFKKVWDNKQESDGIFCHLPEGANFTFAVRRTLRANGYPLEDLGVTPDARHKMTRRDLLNGNEDLIKAAIASLS